MYLAIIVAGLLFALPNVLPASVLERWPSVLPGKPVALGLDLRGGSHLVLEVDGTDLRRERLRSLGDDARRMLREADIPWRSVEAGERGLSISLRTAEQQDRAVDVLAALAIYAGRVVQDEPAGLAFRQRRRQIADRFSPVDAAPVWQGHRFGQCLLETHGLAVGGQQRPGGRPLEDADVTVQDHRRADQDVAVIGCISRG